MKVAIIVVGALVSALLLVGPLSFLGSLPTLVICRQG